MKKTLFTTYVVKVVSRCNLNCSYCYMYNLQDGTYRNQPATITDEITDALCSGIIDHLNGRGVGSVQIIMHGGEPLMLGKKNFRRWVERVRDNFKGSGIEPRFSAQSNGTLIDEEWVDILYETVVRIGLSIDGPKVYHDTFRLDHFGKGSHDTVVNAIRTLQNHPNGKDVFSNVMAVVNPNIPPKEMFDFWNEIDVIGFDLSLPHANHVHLPPEDVSAYTEWLIEFFDLWYDSNRPDRKVRYFENMMRMFFGYPVSSDNIGGKPVDVLVVETDGSLEPTDAFKCCFDGATKLGKNIKTASLDELYDIAMVRDFQSGGFSLCQTCKTCPAVDVCGGGYMPHRYSQTEGFQNPSIYCEALFALTHHIRSRILTDMPTDIKERIVA